jgi:hypothetical protein
MTDSNTLADKNIKHFGKLSTCYEYLQKRAAKVQKLTEVEQINLENECTVLLKNLVYYGFLEMVIDDDDNIGGH